MGGVEAAQQGPADPKRLAVLWLLALTTALNVGFVLFDPRMMALDPLSAAGLLSGGAAYVVAWPLCARGRAAGYALALIVAPLSSFVVVGDNVLLFGSTPNAATYALNVAFFLLQVPLAWLSAAWLLSHRRDTGNGAPTGR